MGIEDRRTVSERHASAEWHLVSANGFAELGLTKSGLPRQDGGMRIIPAIPDPLPLREVRVRIAVPGFRVRSLMVVTTLTDGGSLFPGRRRRAVPPALVGRSCKQCL
jgi:hypothetical protein